MLGDIDRLDQLTIETKSAATNFRKLVSGERAKEEKRQRQ